MQYAQILGTGSYLPARRMSNDDISKIVDTSDEWITERTGIKARHIAAPGEQTSDLALQAARAALAAHQQGKYLEVYDALMNERALDRAAIDDILAAHGVDMVKAQAAIASPEMTRHVTDIHTTAATLGLQGTPTFFINGKASASIEPAAVAKMIEDAKR